MVLKTFMQYYGYDDMNHHQYLGDVELNSDEFEFLNHFLTHTSYCMIPLKWT